ncbi:MAG: penicillin-binding protein activator [Pontixanthobacter sp.]
MTFGRIIMDRRNWMIAGASLLMAGCKVIPDGPAPTTQAPPPQTGPTTPDADRLPTDDTRHLVALLVPLSGDNGAVGKSIADATTMAILDTNADNLRITTYDTARGARAAARRAVGDGNKLILGPLMADNVSAVLAEARPADIPLISYSNDASVAGPDVFIMGHVPSQSIARTVEFARGRGANTFAVLKPAGDYGDQAEDATRDALRQYGGSLVTVENYARGNTSIISAAQRLKQKGGYDAVLIADSARLAALAAAELKPTGRGNAQLMGTELLSGEASITRNSALRGMLFSAVSDSRFKRFSDSYSSRFGTQPFRIATLGYDSVLLTLRVAQNWKVGQTFPVSQLRDDDGFLGLDGVFRFMPNGVVERSMEVREVTNGGVEIVDPAPSKFP